MLAINFVVLIVWTIVAPPNVIDKISIKEGEERYDPDEITYECDTSGASGGFIIALIVLQVRELIDAIVIPLH